MSLAHETNVLFYSALVLLVPFMYYLYRGACQLMIEEYCFQRLMMHVAARLQKGYDADLAKLMNNLEKDLVLWPNNPYQVVVRKLGKRYFKDVTPRDGLLTNVEQAKAMTWLLNHESFPSYWKVRKITGYRTMAQLVDIAVKDTKATQNQMLASLLN